MRCRGLGLGPGDTQGHAFNAGTGPRALSKGRHMSPTGLTVVTVIAGQKLPVLSGSSPHCCGVQRLREQFPLCAPCLYLLEGPVYPSQIKCAAQGGKATSGGEQ